MQFTLGILPSTATVDEAESELSAFEADWGKKFPSIGKFWRNHWENLITLSDRAYAPIDASICKIASDIRYPIKLIAE